MTLMRQSPPEQQRSPVAWTIAGSDSGGGAGIQADLRAVHALGVHGCSVVTALTAQNSQAVTRVEFSSPEQIRATIDVLSEDMPPGAVKLGMLGSEETIAEVSRFVAKFAAAGGAVICDPVMVSTSGARLLSDAAREALVKNVFCHAAVITPNLAEAEVLVGRKLLSAEDVDAAATELLALMSASGSGGPAGDPDGSSSGSGSGGTTGAVLIKGGHLEEDGSLAQDLWAEAGGLRCWLTGPRVTTRDTHGTGCTLSSALASGIALGLAPLDAAVVAKAYVAQGLRAAAAAGTRPGRGPGPVAQTSWPCRPDVMPWLTASAAAGAASRPPPPPRLPPGWGGLLPVVDSAAWVARLGDLGVKDIQLRVKDRSPAELDAEVATAVEACRNNGARLWVNDHWRAAVALGAYGVHLGQEDLVAEGAETVVTAIGAAGLRLGLSTHCYSELARALAARPSYISLGPVFETRSKKVRFTPRGLEEVRRWRSLVPPDVPLVAIGGISLADAPAVLAAGADSIAVISAVTGAADVAAAVRDWQGLWGEEPAVTAAAAAVKVA